MAVARAGTCARRSLSLRDSRRGNLLLGVRRRSNFYDLLFRREWPFFYAFDVLEVNGSDVRALPLTERKARLRRIMPTVESRVLFLDSIAQRGCDLFRVACERDLEGIVAKWASGSYTTDGRSTSWLKMKNPTYSQAKGRHELFDRRTIEGGTRRRSAAHPLLALR